MLSIEDLSDLIDWLEASSSFDDRSAHEEALLQRLRDAYRDRLRDEAK